MPSISPPSEPAPARLFDGESAQPQRVTAKLDAEALLLADDAGETRVARALLTRESNGGRITLHRSDLPDWRLVLGGAAADFAAIPHRHRFTATHARWLGGAGAALAAGALLLWGFGNSALVWAAPFVPRMVAVNAGKPIADMIAGGSNGCHAEPGEEALRRLTARVMPRWPVEAVTVRVGRSDDVNAFTLPGGQIVILSGLIEAAKSPDEVAGVLAHELGHVQKRHPNQALLRHFGFDVFAQGLGGNVGSLAATGLYLRNSRAAEREADGVALELMQAGRVSPAGLADFFRRLEGDPNRHDTSRLEQWASLAATHPSDGSRQARFRIAARGVVAEPVLDAAEWRALRNICRRR